MLEFTEGYALVIGIADYQNIQKLPKTVIKDAQDICDLLLSPTNCGYQNEHVRLILQNNATAQSIRESLHWLAEKTDNENTVIIFFSGHGGRLINGTLSTNYLLPFDCDSNNIPGTAISGIELTNLFKNIKANRILVLFDCCYSGGTGELKSLGTAKSEFKSGLDENYYDQLAIGYGRVIMASSRSDELSLVLPNMGNSLFTHYFLEALNGNARTREDGLIRIFDVFDYLSEKVPSQGNQHPIFKAHDLENNFAISLFRGGKKKQLNINTEKYPESLIDKHLLRETIIHFFNVEELEILCADVEQSITQEGIPIQLNLEIVGGNSKSGKVLNLIQFLDRRELLPYLINVVRRERPGII